jgi:5-methylcytosine-specific restriction endonuclease McrA
MIKWYNNPRKLRKKKKQQSRRSRFISSAVKQKVWERDKGKCVLCGSTIDLEYDHDIPFSKGGSNSEENIRLLCRRCNRSKSAKIQ